MKYTRVLLALTTVVTTLAGLAAAACTPLSTLPAVELATNETFLVQIDPGRWMAESYRISPDNRTFAFGNKVDNQQVVVVNGKEQKRYDEVIVSYLIYSPDSKHMAYAARTGDQHFMVIDGKENGPYNEVLYSKLLQYSLEGNRLAYAIKRDGKIYVVIDGKENGPYEDIDYGISARFFNDSIFSRDGQHYAYAAKTDGKWFAVMDGQAEKKFDLVKGIVLSKTGKHSAYLAQSDNVTFMMIDGKPAKPYDEMSHVIFSPDENRMAFIATSGKDHFVVADAQEGSRYTDIGNLLVFTQDSKSLVFIGIMGSGQFLVVNDQQAGPYRQIDPPVFSPDGNRAVFMADDGTSWLVIIDGVKKESYPDVDATSIVFSADSKRVGYVVQTQGGEGAESSGGTTESETTADDRFAVVIDGKAGKEYNGIGQGSLSFSPDGLHYAYSAVDDRGVFIIMDGGELGPYDNTSSLAPIFSPDSKLLIYTAVIKDDMFLMVNGQQSKPYAGILNAYGGKIVIDSPSSFHYLAVADNKVYLVENTVTVK